MIKGYKNAKTRKVHETGNPRGFKGLDGKLAADHMDMLDAVSHLQEINPLASIGLHKLKGTRKGQWAMSVNDPWRICFIPARNGGWLDIEITDYHKG
ncbi:MAG: type II toxin-antitoxin system RelE/ParE family toxin [Rhodospirillales bacterium]|jgi:proteic killer suppression protein|nr:type II toxin-antitoxin system RelE/ParE family toxin [Rhodospirillales bacterium]HIJ42875.1 plasmid maintenance system killer protein [Rhodospirillaceae bacterium]MDP7097083.1 type II toxin-antitoxin system RelE/ParE family toxin [Rhodospirillales bacterium]MDP7215788.1 type II toxin-antitoxin system RelE/ParE family toxin [Rhodospirillales bacterium]HIJ93016.1 plasmid maintenance system killer protein [Rhodospirillaceae bacterium]